MYSVENIGKSRLVPLLLCYKPLVPLGAVGITALRGRMLDALLLERLPAVLVEGLEALLGVVLAGRLPDGDDEAEGRVVELGLLCL